MKAPMKLYSNNKFAINIANNLMQHDRTKHVKVHRHFIKEKLESGLICMPCIPMNKQLFDIFTKGLLKPTFDYLTRKLGMTDIYQPLEGGVLKIALL